MAEENGYESRMRDLQSLGKRLVGGWTTEATHPGLPGAVIHGSSEIEWLEGERFLIYRTRYDHPDIPDGVSIIGAPTASNTHYFDTRGVHRIYDVKVTDEGWDDDDDDLRDLLLQLTPSTRDNFRRVLIRDPDDRDLISR